MAEDIKVSEFIVNELSEERLEELKDTNAVPPNEMFLTDEEGEQFTRGLPLGTIIPLAVVTDDPYLQPLDGRSLAQDGMYAEFCTWLKNRVLANSSNVPTCTIDEYASEMNTYFQCGKFVINDTAETVTSGNFSVPGNSIKLPTITEFIASSNGGDAIGLAENDLTKVHQHQIGMTTTNWGTSPMLNYVGKVGERFNSNDGSSSIALTMPDGGEETRPKNIRYPYYIVVATSLNDSAAINAEGVVNEVNEVKDVLSRTEQVEVVYDMSSNDVDINWEYTTGIPAGYVTGKDFTKYKKLIVYWQTNYICGVCEVDLTKEMIVYSGTYNGSGCGTSWDGTNQFFGGVNIQIENNKTTLHVAYLVYYGGIDAAAGKKITKIEGVY